MRDKLRRVRATHRRRRRLHRRDEMNNTIVITTPHALSSVMSTTTTSSRHGLRHVEMRVIVSSRDDHDGRHCYTRDQHHAQLRSACCCLSRTLSLTRGSGHRQLPRVTTRSQKKDLIAKRSDAPASHTLTRGTSFCMIKCGGTSSPQEVNRRESTGYYLVDDTRLESLLSESLADADNRGPTVVRSARDRPTVRTIIL